MEKHFNNIQEYNQPNPKCGKLTGQMIQKKEEGLRDLRERKTTCNVRTVRSQFEQTNYKNKLDNWKNLNQ